MTEQEVFNFYMVEFPATRERYGIFRDKQGKYYISDQSTIDSLPEYQKGLLRSFCVEMRKQGKWLGTPKKEAPKIYWE